MPDKPKRRKNKNKRKNKNPNKNNANKSETSDTLSVDSCDHQEDNVNDGCENDDIVLGVNNSTTSITEDINVSRSDVNSDLPSTTLFSELDSKSDHQEIVFISKDSDKLQVQEDNNDPPAYLVEPPGGNKKTKPKLDSVIKSKSVDNDESPTIVEITEEVDTQNENEKSLAVVDTSNIIITDAESDVEWEKIDELCESIKPDNFAAEAYSVLTIPLQIAQCKQTQSLSPDQENSLRCYLQSLNLPTSPSNLNAIEIRSEIEQIINREIKNRLRKKGLAEDTSFQRGTISRCLDVIDEEGSSESSATSRRHSYLSDKKSDTDDLDDEVFENKAVVSFNPNTISNIRNRRLIPQQCLLVDAKLKEPEISEARGDWTLKTMETITGAEVVYLTDSSSSTSSLYDVGNEIENDEVSDASIRIITPTIEVTDTEKFLTNTFIAKEKKISEKGQSKKNDFNNEFSEDMKHMKKEIVQDHATCIENPHEIIVLSTEDIKTNLFVKDSNLSESNLELVNNSNDNETDKRANSSEINSNHTEKKDTYDLEIKVLKCELNDAINNLIKEMTPDTEPDNNKDAYTRQDSSSSVCSSQSTAKYNPNYSSLNDVSNLLHEDTTTSHQSIKSCETDSKNADISSHVKEVFQCVTGDPSQNKDKNAKSKKEPLALRDLCVKKIASFPFGNKILEELAHVSERLQSMSILALRSKDSSKLLKEKLCENTIPEKHQTKMPYFPLPDISSIEKVSLSTKDQDHVPPPVHPRNSSLKKAQDEQQWTAIPTVMEPVYLCLSPSQKMLMEKTNTVIKKEEASQLVDIHKKFVDRRGYNEKLNENIDTTSPIVPFKSQTGSRLLALIRDPSVTNNINLSSGQKDSFKSIESLPKLNYYENKRNFETSNSNTDSVKYPKSFKPIPPPRPKKFSSSFYESDESSDFTDNSFRKMRSEKKIFHYSTGNLNKEIENDISSIQNMHRYYSNMRDLCTGEVYPRRPSLPKDLCDQQMEYIRQKEKEVEEEIRRIEQDKIKFLETKSSRSPLILDKSQETEFFDLKNFKTLRKDALFSDTKSRRTERGKLSSVYSKSQEELLREKMYSEYVNQMAEREQRRQQKFIKITHPRVSTSVNSISKSMPTLDALESKVNNRIEKEFISRARERWQKLGIEDPETEDEKENNKDIYKEPKIVEHKIKVIQAGEEKDVSKLPNHLQEFVGFTARNKDQENIRTGESKPEREPTHVVVFYAVVILVLAVGKFVLRLLRHN